MRVQNKTLTFAPAFEKEQHGGLAQLARAPALHAGGQRFESVILHTKDLWHDVTSWKIKIWSKPKELKVYIIRSVLKTECVRDNESKQGRMADALALGGDEGRDKLR